LTDLGDKVDEADKTEINTKIDAVKKALEGTDVEAIKAATEDLQKKFYDVSAKVYQQNGGAQANQGAGFDPNAQNGGAQGGNGGNYEGDYTVVDDDDKK
ncbi:MAG: molecular chaperone DnaK, partial [Clostridia bacterium]|nr:molecular chaperone DnaK [Clostridia bacterium]